MHPVLRCCCGPRWVLRWVLQRSYRPGEDAAERRRKQILIPLWSVLGPSVACVVVASVGDPNAPPSWIVGNARRGSAASAESAGSSTSALAHQSRSDPERFDLQLKRSGGAVAAGTGCRRFHTERLAPAAADIGAPALAAYLPSPPAHMHLCLRPVDVRQLAELMLGDGDGGDDAGDGGAAEDQYRGWFFDALRCGDAGALRKIGERASGDAVLGWVAAALGDSHQRRHPAGAPARAAAAVGAPAPPPPRVASPTAAGLLLEAAAGERRRAEVWERERAEQEQRRQKKVDEKRRQ
eukprot:gene28033-28545_t